MKTTAQVTITFVINVQSVKQHGAIAFSANEAVEAFAEKFSRVLDGGHAASVTNDPSVTLDIFGPRE